jgi:hypothetical protein
LPRIVKRFTAQIRGGWPGFARGSSVRAILSTDERTLAEFEGRKRAFLLPMFPQVTALSSAGTILLLETIIDSPRLQLRNHAVG